jgi:hypothetical protein
MIWLHKLLSPKFWVEAFTFYSGGGSGGGGSSTTKSVTTNLPEYAKPFYEELLKQSGKQIYETDSSGKVTGVKKYEKYPKQRLAKFTPEQQAVQQEVAGMTTPGGFETAAGTLGTVGSQAGSAAQTGIQQALSYEPGAGYAPEQVTSESFVDPGVAERYIDPYTRSVLDVQKREARRQADIQKNQAAMASIGRGTFGGARQALMQTEADRNTQQLLAKIEAEGQADALRQAREQFQSDQAQRLQAQQANQQAGLQAQQLGQQAQQFQAGLGKDIGLAGLQTGLETGKASGALSATEQMSNLERLKAQAASAAEKQALEQEQRNLDYQQYMDAKNYQRGLLEYQSNILRGTAGALGSTQVAYAPRPSLASQIGGLGLAGLGLYNVLGNR